MLNLKKLLCILLVVVLATTMCIVVSADSNVITVGDVSGDKSLSIIDLVRLKKYMDNQDTQINLSAIGCQNDTEITEEHLKKMRKVLLGSEKYQDITIYAEWGKGWNIG